MMLLCNILGAISDVLYGVSGLMRTKKKILFLGILADLAGILCDLLVGGYTAVLTLTMSLISQIANYRKERGKIFSAVYIAILIVISIFLSQNGWIDAIPVIATSEYVMVISCTKKTEYTRLALLVNTVLWCIFNFCFKLHASAFIEVISAALLFIKIIRKQPEES